MLLAELQGVKHLYQKTREDIIKALEKQGIHCIASGTYGSVFTRDSWDHVIKIIEKDDPEYLSFVNWVIKNPNKHFPKFKKKPLKMHAIVIIDPVWEGETPYQAYDKWIRDQMDFAKEYDEDYENNTSGPNYLEKNRPKIVSKIVDNFLDDIPF